MVTVVFSALVAGRLYPHSIYTIKLFKRGIDIKGGRDINVLKAHTVREIMDTNFETVLASLPLIEIFHRIEESPESYFIVVNKAGRLHGVLSFQDIRSLLSQHELDYLVIADDVVAKETIVLHVDDDLEKAQTLFGRRDFKLLPVVSPSEPDKTIGVVRREDLIDYYNRRLIETLRR
jgi:CIC family chloride channel protein